MILTSLLIKLVMDYQDQLIVIELFKMEVALFHVWTMEKLWLHTITQLSGIQLQLMEELVAYQEKVKNIQVNGKSQSYLLGLQDEKRIITAGNSIKTKTKIKFKNVIYRNQF